MDSREQFEAHYDDWSGESSGMTFSLRMGDSYRKPLISAAWTHWKASRAAVVVELPAAEDVGEISVVMMHHPDDVRAAIEAAGVKVAP